MFATAPSARLPFDSGAYDFGFTGRFPARGQDRPARVALAKELYRILKPGGALLLVLGNRLCPIDFTRNGRFVHSPFADTALSLKDIKQIFIQDGGFSTTKVLNPAGHFAWRRAPAALRPLGALLESFWKCAGRCPPLYNSIFNPTLISWLTRN
jgi:SAM-dependent methyltransferase